MLGPGKVLAPRRPYSSPPEDNIAVQQKRIQKALSGAKTSREGWAQQNRQSAAPFCATPSVVQFIDFEVGTTYSQKVTITNTSWGFNTFKVLPLTVALQDFFDISYQRAGSMSAGTSAVLTVKFTPRLPDDINDEIPIMTQTGPVKIPLICRRQKVSIEITPSTKSLAFGAVVVAEKASLTITIANHGALPTTMDIVGDAAGAFSEHAPYITDVVTVPYVLTLKPFKTEDIVIPANSTVKLVVGFHPLSICSLDTHLVLRFRDQFTDAYTLFLTGQSIEAPVYVEEPQVMDFECCYTGTLYRSVLTLRNRGKVSMRCSPVVDLEPLNKYLEFVPKMGFIQPESKLQFQVKFQPAEILRECSEYNPDTKELNATIVVQVHDQLLPVKFQLHALLCNSLLEFNPSALDFLSCSTAEGASLPLRVKNSSLLPQRIGFIKLPPEITVDTSHMTLVPGEEGSFMVNYTPQKAGQFSANLTLLTTRNEQYAIRVKGVGKSPPLEFSEQILRLQASAIGEVVTANVLLSHTARGGATQRFVFESTEPYLTVAPVQGELVHGESEPIVFTFHPAMIGDFGAWGSSREGEKWSRHRTVVVKCFCSWELRYIHLQFCLTVIQPVLRAVVLNEENAGGGDGAASCSVDFGSTPVGRKSVKTIRITNTQEIPKSNFLEEPSTIRRSSLGFTASIPGYTELTLLPIDPYGPFTVTRNPVGLIPGQVCDIVIEFAPKSNESFKETVQIQSSLHSLVLNLRGTGLAPGLRLASPVPNPLDNETEVFLHFGTCIVGDTCVKELQLSNPCTFDVMFEIQVNRIHPYNSSGTDPFTFSIMQGSVQAKSTLPIHCKFSPDHEFGYYKCEAVVTYAGDNNNKTIRIAGGCSNKPMYVTCPLGVPFTDNFHDADSLQVDVANACKNHKLQLNTIEGLDALDFDLHNSKEDMWAQMENDVTPVSTISVQQPTGKGKGETSGVPLNDYISSCPDTKRYLLEFNINTLGETCTQYFSIGNAKVYGGETTTIQGKDQGKKAPSSGIAGEYIIEGITEAYSRLGWRVEPARGPVESGGRRAVAISFTPSRALLANLPISGVTLIHQVVLVVILRGAGGGESAVVLHCKGVLRETGLVEELRLNSPTPDSSL